MAFLSQEVIHSIGFKSIGERVLISDKASFYGVGNISIGSDSRIDDFCILSAGLGGIVIGQHVHIACYVSLIGEATIEIENFAGVSGKCSIYSSSDDFSGNYLTGPTIDPDYTNVRSEAVHIGRHVVVGAGTTILPGVVIGDYSAVGAMSLVNKNCEESGIYSGVPARFIKKRSNRMLALEQEFLASKL